MIYIILISSTARCILPKHRVVLHLPIILVCMFLPWTDIFFYHYDVSLHFYADDSYICLWFLTSFLFLCLAGIKLLMFQNHIQLKLCKTEFLVMSSLKLETIQLSLSLFFFCLCWPPISLQTGIQWVIFDNCFSPSHMYGNLSFIMETLLECRCFSPLLMQEAFQSWFTSFRLNYWETWPFLKPGYLHSKNSPDFAALFLTLTIHHCTACSLISNCFSGLVFPLWGSFAWLSFKLSFHFTFPSILTTEKGLSFTREPLLKIPQEYLSGSSIVQFKIMHQKKWEMEKKNITIMRFIYTR